MNRVSTGLRLYFIAIPNVLCINRDLKTTEHNTISTTNAYPNTPPMMTESKPNTCFTFHGFTLDFAARPRIMAVLNVTPDSFSDGGIFFQNGTLDLDLAVETALAMQAAGADLIDIGGESTRPGSTPVSLNDEKARVIPVIERLAKKLSIPISIDTYKHDVAEAALRAGAAMVNDISGFHFEPRLAELCGKTQTPAILMHIRQKPNEMAWSYADKNAYADVVADVKRYLSDSLSVAAQHHVSQTILDVGFGFGKTVDGNYELLRRLGEFHSFGKPILAGLSRKSFIGKAISKNGTPAPVEERLFGTVAANTIALMNGAAMLRVHDVKAAADAVAVFLATQKAVTET
jgi:dihydropteroate synthase